MPSYGLRDTETGPGYLRKDGGLAVREDCPGGCCGCDLWRRVLGCDGVTEAWICATATCTDGSPIAAGTVIRLDVGGEAVCYTAQAQTDPDPAGTRLNGTSFECVPDCASCVQLYKLATRCCPSGDALDVLFVPSQVACNVALIGGLCYTIHHEPLFVDCDGLTDEQFEQLGGNVLCLPPDANTVKASAVTCTPSDSCQDPLCEDCGIVFDCCIGPINNRCGARPPIGGGTTATFYLTGSARYTERVPECKPFDCGSIGTLSSGGSASAVVTFGNGDCSWGGSHTVPNSGATDSACPASGDSQHIDEPAGFVAALYLSGGTAVTRTSCSPGTSNTPGAPAMLAGFDCGLAGIQVASRLNATGSSTYGIDTGFFCDSSSYNSCSCASGIIRGGKCAGVLGAWTVFRATSVQDIDDNCPGATAHYTHRAFVLATTAKVAPCQGTAPDDGERPDPTDPAVRAAVETQMRAMGRGCCG